MAREVAIGIDLGTTYSCVAVYRNKKVEVIASSDGHRTSPSYVAFTDKERLIGHGAKNQCALNPLNTVFNAKRLIGRCFSDPIVQDDMKLWPFCVQQGPKDKPIIIVDYKDEEKKFIAEEISAAILTRMKEIADDFLGCEVKKAVVTVPAYFNNEQRECTKAAGRIAGLEVIGIINEPTAAAIAYGVDSKAGSKGARNVLVFDLGGGTFDVSLVTLEGKNCNVLATGGDTHLGGEDFDDRMVDYLAKEFEKKHKKDISSNPRALRKLRNACEKAKIELSTRKQQVIEVDGLEGIDFSYKMTRAKFEQMNLELFNKCMEPVDKCLVDAKMDKDDVHDLLLVGGSTRIPKVQELLKEFFGGKDLSKTINPDEAVAYGAAIHASIICSGGGGGGSSTDNVPPIDVTDVTPLSLGVEIGGGVMSVLIPRNKPIPTEATKAYTTFRDNQPFVSIKVFQGEKEMTKDNHLLGEFKLSEIPPAPKGTPKIDVCFAIDTNGIINVSAEMESAGKRNEIKIENDSRLSNEEMGSMIKEAEKYKKQDAENKTKMEVKNDLETYAYKVREVLSGELEEDKEWVCKLNPEKKTEMDDAAAYVLEWSEENEDAEVVKYEAMMKILVKICDHVMKKRDDDTLTPEEVANWRSVYPLEKRLRPGMTPHPDIDSLLLNIKDGA